MRLVTFLSNGSSRLGALHVWNDREVIVDLNSADPRLPADIVQFLRMGASARELATEVLRTAPAPALHDRASIALKAVIPNPGKVICIGVNYRDHALETNIRIPDVPTVFAKYSNVLIGHGEA